MKTKLLSLVTLLAIVCNLQADERKTVKAKLNEATVFFSGAELIHSANASLTKGDNEIYVEGLSPSIDKNSLKIKTSNGVLISSFEFSVDYLADQKQNNNTITKKLQDSIDNYYITRLQQVNSELKINQELSAILKKSTDKNVSGSEKGLPIDELIKTMEYYQTKSTQLEGALVLNQTQKQKYETAINRLRNQISQESLKNNKTAGILKLSLSAPIAAACQLSITYHTPSAAWIPYYDINIASTDKPIKIVTKAKVRQVTGLDWDKTKLTLSTATPSNGKVAPLFSTWFLNEMTHTYAYGRGSVKNKSLMMQNSYSYDMVSVEELVVAEKVVSTKKRSRPAVYVVDGSIMDEATYNSIDPAIIKETAYLDPQSAIDQYGNDASGGAHIIKLKSMEDYVSISENQIDLTYNIALPISVPGNGKEQSVELKVQETDAEYKYYSAPKLDRETFLLAEISNWEKLNLLSGKANITYDGTYIGESVIDANSTHAKLTLTLGADKRVVVKREKLKDYSSTKFLGSDTKQVFTYRITIKNNQNKPIKMVLKDQYPISSHKSIEVELLEKDTTNPTANKKEIGVITWEETFEAGETRVYQISYSVKYPKNMTLNL